MNRRERRALELSDQGLEVVEEYYEQNSNGPSYIGIRAALEWAGLEWEQARTGSAAQGDGDEYDVPEIWAAPWVAALCKGVMKHMGLRPDTSPWPDSSVGRIRDMERELAGLLRHAVNTLGEEHRASLRVVTSMVDDDVGWLVLQFLSTQRFMPSEAVWPTEEVWRALTLIGGALLGVEVEGANPGVEEQRGAHRWRASVRRQPGYRSALATALKSIVQRVDGWTMCDATGLPCRGFQAVKWAGDPTFSGKGPFSQVLSQAHEGADVTIHDMTGFVGYLRHVQTRGHSRDTNQRQLACAVRAWREAALVEGVGLAQWKDGLDEPAVQGIHAQLRALPPETVDAVRAVFDLSGGAAALELLRTTPGYE